MDKQENKGFYAELIVDYNNWGATWIEPKEEPWNTIETHRKYIEHSILRK